MSFKTLVSVAEYWQILKSVAASMFGVQSEKNREMDFQKKSVVPFVVVGIIFVLIFIATIMFVVNLAVS
ncbi:DUF2970 domain-containing protein [Paraneptunicella aestuarii]|uniref:DUF2970 domain-containing protein n=1 Tax=Paraneptunicella aestuarii TaxID=2831148 RepID=UPI001E60EA6F|nr:DUF2970 domain-containing protein [Paraneptunicella aestuarii]